MPFDYAHEAAAERAKPAASDLEAARAFFDPANMNRDDRTLIEQLIDLLAERGRVERKRAKPAASDYEIAHRIIDALVEAAYMAEPMDGDAVNIVTKILSQTTNDEA